MLPGVGKSFDGLMPLLVTTNMQTHSSDVWSPSAPRRMGHRAAAGCAAATADQQEGHQPRTHALARGLRTDPKGVGVGGLSGEPTPVRFSDGIQTCQLAGNPRNPLPPPMVQDLVALNRAKSTSQISGFCTTHNVLNCGGIPFVSEGLKHILGRPSLFPVQL